MFFRCGKVRTNQGTAVGSDTEGTLGADSTGFHDPKMRIRSKVTGQQPDHTAVQRCQASRPCPRKHQEVGVSYLTMSRELDVTGELSRHAVNVIGPEFVAVHGCDVLQQGKSLSRRNRIRGQRGVGTKPDKSELGQGAGRPAAGRGFPFEPGVGGIVMNMRRLHQGSQQVEIQDEDQNSFSYCFTQSRVSTVPSREISNTGKPLRFRRFAVSGRSPRRARSDNTAPTERFRSIAIDLAASRISSSMLSVVLMPRRISQ